MPTCKFTKNNLSHIFFHVFCLHFLRTHHDYFFRRSFETMRPKFLSGNISKKYLQFTCSITIHLSQLPSCWMWQLTLSQYSFRQINWNSLQYKGYKNVLLFPACVFSYVVLFNKKLIVVHHDGNTFLLYFNICIKLTLSAIILTVE